MSEEVSCKDHPDAPHGFCRDASHSEDRYVCECEFWEPPAEPVEQSQIEQAVNRFLGWKLPKDFAPDNTIIFGMKGQADYKMPECWPIGTNLFTADQAKAMFEYCLQDTHPAAPVEQKPVLWMQSNHFNTFRMKHTGSSMMLARCSHMKAMDDFVPLYEHPAAPITISDERILELWSGDSTGTRPVMGKNKVLAFARAILAEVQGK